MVHFFMLCSFIFLIATGRRGGVLDVKLFSVYHWLISDADASYLHLALFLIPHHPAVCPCSFACTCVYVCAYMQVCDAGGATPECPADSLVNSSPAD